LYETPEPSESEVHLLDRSKLFLPIIRFGLRVPIAKRGCSFVPLMWKIDLPSGTSISFKKIVLYAWSSFDADSLLF
jgi:hypothetical protein